MLDACTKCGACFKACPIAEPAGLGGANPEAVVSGVLDILRSGKGAEESEKWAKACMASGECIKACDYGVNPRFLLTMARLAMLRTSKDVPERRKAGVTQFRKVGEDVERAVAAAAFRKRSDPARPEAVEGDRARGLAGCRVLHRLQRAQDAPHRAALPRHHGHDRHRLSGDGRADALLRHRPASRRRHRHAGAVSPTTPSTSCRSRRPGRCWRGARAASCSSARPCCRPSSARPGRCRST